METNYSNESKYAKNNFIGSWWKLKFKRQTQTIFYHAQKFNYNTWQRDPSPPTEAWPLSYLLSGLQAELPFAHWGHAGTVLQLVAQCPLLQSQPVPARPQNKEQLTLCPTELGDVNTIPLCQCPRCLSLAHAVLSQSERDWRLKDHMEKRPVVNG